MALSIGGVWARWSGEYKTRHKDANTRYLTNSLSPSISREPSGWGTVYSNRVLSNLTIRNMSLLMAAMIHIKFHIDILELIQVHILHEAQQRKEIESK